jgi:hypothetical protein
MLCVSGCRHPRYHEDVFGITIGNHAAAVDSARKHGAIRQLAGQGLADIIAKLDEGLDINTGGFRG